VCLLLMGVGCHPLDNSTHDVRTVEKERPHSDGVSGSVVFEARVVGTVLTVLCKEFREPRGSVRYNRYEVSILDARGMESPLGFGFRGIFQGAWLDCIQSGRDLVEARLHVLAAEYAMATPSGSEYYSWCVRVYIERDQVAMVGVERIADGADEVPTSLLIGD
jgi:hypothetical protein